MKACAMTRESRQPSSRLITVADSVIAGLIANAITAYVALAIGVIGGWLPATKGLAIAILILLTLSLLLIPVQALKDHRAGTLPSEINAGRIIVDTILYAIVFGVLTWAAAQYLFSRG